MFILSRSENLDLVRVTISESNKFRLSRSSQFKRGKISSGYKSKHPSRWRISTRWPRSPTCPPLFPRPNCRPSMKPASQSVRMIRSSNLVPLMYLKKDEKAQNWSQNIICRFLPCMTYCAGRIFFQGCKNLKILEKSKNRVITLKLSQLPSLFQKTYQKSLKTLK